MVPAPPPRTEPPRCSQTLATAPTQPSPMSGNACTAAVSLRRAHAPVGAPGACSTAVSHSVALSPLAAPPCRSRCRRWGQPPKCACRCRLLTCWMTDRSRQHHEPGLGSPLSEIWTSLLGRHSYGDATVMLAHGCRCLAAAKPPVRVRGRVSHGAIGVLSSRNRRSHTLSTRSTARPSPCLDY